MSYPHPPSQASRLVGELLVSRAVGRCVFAVHDPCPSSPSAFRVWRGLRRYSTAVAVSKSESIRTRRPSAVQPLATFEQRAIRHSCEPRLENRRSSATVERVFSTLHVRPGNGEQLSQQHPAAGSTRAPQLEHCREYSSVSTVISSPQSVQEMDPIARSFQCGGILLPVRVRPFAVDGRQPTSGSRRPLVSPTGGEGRLWVEASVW